MFITKGCTTVQHRTQCATSSPTLLWTTVKNVVENSLLWKRGRGIARKEGGKRVDQAPPERHTCRKTKKKKEKGSSGLTRGGNSNDIALVQLLELSRQMVLPRDIRLHIMKDIPIHKLLLLSILSIFYNNIFFLFSLHPHQYNSRNGIMHKAGIEA